MDGGELETIEGYDAALLSGKRSTLRGQNSDVSIDVPDGIENIIWRKTHTNLTYFEGNIPENQSIIAPIVEVHIKSPNFEDADKGAKRHFVIRVPHWLHPDDDISGVRVKYGDTTEGELIELRPNEGKDPFFEVDSKFITIHTSHFNWYQPIIDWFYKKVLFLMAVPSVTFSKDYTTADINVYLCSPQHKTMDYKTVSK